MYRVLFTFLLLERRFVPLLLMYPAADIPTLQLSLDASLSATEHLRIGRALQPLRDEGVLIIGSGFITHDLSFRLRADQAHSFTDAVAAALVGDAKQQLAQQVGDGDAQSQREAALERWESLPSARAAHPREEHLLPLMVAAAAGGSADRETRVTRMGQNLAPAPLLFDSYRFD
jgi:aromatic ring-opening dioxygenase catalytic subunit (LigB family)